MDFGFLLLISFFGFSFAVVCIIDRLLIKKMQAKSQVAKQNKVLQGETMIKDLKKLWATPSAEVIALKELEEAKRRLLEAQTAREYAESMCKYREAQIKRLTAYLHNATEAA